MKQSPSFVLEGSAVGISLCMLFKNTQSVFFKLFDISAEKEEMEQREQEAAIFNSSVFEYFKIPFCALVCNLHFIFFVFF